MTLAPHTRNEFENYIQECIPVGYQPPACRPYVLHNEKVRTCPESLFGGADAGAMYRVPRLGPCVYRGGLDQGLSEEGASIVKANASWVMGTGDLPPHIADRQTQLKHYLSATSLAGGNKTLNCVVENWNWISSHSLCASNVNDLLSPECTCLFLVQLTLV